MSLSRGRLKMQEGEDDVDINTSDTSAPTHNQISGPITRARTRQLNNQGSLELPPSL
jgi:hypothetical protein